MIHPVQIDNSFVMPAEVATRLLLNRRISNKTRKLAMRARGTRIQSRAPIHNEGPHSAFYDAKAQIAPETKIAKKYAARSLAWLDRCVARCDKLRRKLQIAYQKTEAPKLRQQLDMLAARCDLFSDCAKQEIAKRARKNL